jgi:hypothetical protein
MVSTPRVVDVAVLFGLLGLATAALAPTKPAHAAADRSASATTIWLGGVDPASGGAAHKGPADYMALFEPNAPWNDAASQLRVFQISTQMTLRGTDAQLLAIIKGLKARHIKLAVAMGLISGPGKPGECGWGMEGYILTGSPEKAAKRIKDLGGEIDYIAMDEPVWFGHAIAAASGGREGCRFPLVDMADQVSRQFETMRKYFPNLRLGDIEPVNASAFATSQDPRFVQDVMTFADLIEKKTGQKLAFLHADVAWKWAWQPQFLDMARQARDRAIHFGVICDGDAGASDDAGWVRQALERCQAIAADPRARPEEFIAQSWEPLPTRMLPESDPGTLTFEALQLEYLGRGDRRRPDQ